MNNALVTSVSASAKVVSRLAGLLAFLALGLVASAAAADLPKELHITRVKSLYSSPYLLDISINVHDEKDEPVRLNPSEFGVICKEVDPQIFVDLVGPFTNLCGWFCFSNIINRVANDTDIPPISVSETGFRLLTAKKQLKGFVVLDYTRSLLDPVLNGDRNGDLKSDAAEAMENAAKTLVSTLPGDAQIGLFEFHRSDAGFPPQEIASLIRDKAYLTNQIDHIWTNVVWTSGSSLCWDTLYMALNEFPQENPADDQRFLVFLSDGNDESSIHTITNVIALAQTNGVSIYCVGYGHELTQEPLTYITTQTGGGYYAATNTDDMVRLFQKISDELQSPYILRWATLQRTSPFIPLFQLSLTNTNSVVWANATNIPYSPQSYVGNELEGHLQFDTSLEPGNVASLILRTSYIPRGVTRLRVNFSTLYPLTVDHIAFDDGGVCPTNWNFTVHQTNGIGYFEVSSPTPEDVFSDLSFATLGKLVEFKIQGVANLTDCFYGLSVDNSLYRQPGGPSLVIDNSYAVSSVTTNPQHGTPIEWLNRYGFTTNLALAEITDHDGDDALTWQEYLAGTNPTNAASVFRLISATHAPDGWHISFNTESNQVYHLDFSDTFNTWTVLATNLIGDGRPRTVVDPVVATHRFYRAVLTGTTNQPVTLGFVPGGLFTRGDVFNQDPSDEAPTNTIYVSAFYIDQYEVKKEFWDSVKGWAMKNGYNFDNVGISKAANHPIHTVNWYDAVKWCNARSQKEGLTPCYYADNGLGTLFTTGQILPFVKWDANGYRLPTEAEWEKAARGGASGHRFPWADSDNITHAQANYYSSTDSPYDTSSTRGYHPTFNDGIGPFTSPVGYFAPNGYGLYDMAGNVWEWCWDLYGIYPSGSVTDPHGANTGFYRARRGGSWHKSAAICQTAERSFLTPTANYADVGLRCVRTAAQ